MRRCGLRLVCVLGLGLLSLNAWAQLKQGDFVAIAGDSITEQKQYSVFIEDYLLMCKPQPDLRVMQFGWSGEVAPGFLSKMPKEALKFPFTVATTAYGMNDGGYSPMNDAKAKRYRDAMQGIVDNFKKHGDQFIVVGPDGVHPSQNGQLCMAYAFLKGLGVDGNIGTITVDLAANKAEATDGHKVLAVNNGAVELESTKYPFCFYGDPEKVGSTSGIIE